MIHNNKLTKKKNIDDSVNLIPMINLVFLLLIFFLLTGVIQKKEDPTIIVPESKQGVRKNNITESQTIQIDENGIIKMEGNLIKFEDLQKLKFDKKNRIILNIDKNLKIIKTNEVLKALKSSGLKKVFVNVNDKK